MYTHSVVYLSDHIAYTHTHPHTHTHTHTHTHAQLISQGATSSGLSELIIAIGRSQDPYNLSEKIVPHLEVLLKNDVTNNEKCKNTHTETHTDSSPLLPMVHCGS